MTEKKYKPVSDYQNLTPDIHCLDALKGKVSQPLQLKEDKLGRIAITGPCMIDLPDENDKKDWHGIFNHSITIARYSSFLACELERKGFNSRLILRKFLMVVSFPTLVVASGTKPVDIPKQ